MFTNRKREKVFEYFVLIITKDTIKLDFSHSPSSQKGNCLFNRPFL